MDKSTNIFKDDPVLKAQMGDLDGVTTKAAFSSWKTSFLAVVQSFLSQDGSIKAEAAYQGFTKNIVGLEKTKGKIQGCVNEGSLSAEKASVKSRRFLNELKASLTIISKALQELLPGNKSDIVAYTNYHMGAILIREGFQSYASLHECDMTLQEMKEQVLQYIADKQLIAEIDYYREKLQSFCAIMADLGIMKICNKAQEVAKLTEEEDPEEDLEMFIATAPPPPVAAPPPVAPPAAAPKSAVEPPQTPPVLPVKAASVVKDEPAAVVPKEEPPPPQKAPKEEPVATLPPPLVAEPIVAEEKIEPPPVPEQKPEPEPEPEPEPIKPIVPLPKEKPPQPSQPRARTRPPPPPPPPPPKKKTLPPPSQPKEKSAPPPQPPTLQKTQQRPQTITITATHKAPIDDDDADPTRPGALKKKKKKKKAPGDDEPDLPKTVKPKSPPRFGNNVGRGVGRTLSKEEAKEKRIPPKKNPGAGTNPPSSSPQNPSAKPKRKPPVKDKDDEDPPQEDDEQDEQDEDNEGKKEDKEDASKASNDSNQPKDATKRPSEAGKMKSQTAKKQENGKGATPAAVAKKQQPKVAEKEKVVDTKINITIHYSKDGSQIKMKVDPKQNTLGGMKKQLEQKTGLPVDRQRLCTRFVDREFELDEMKLYFYGVHEGSDLDLDPKWIEINVEMPDGKRHKLQVAPASDTIDSLKQKIAEKSGLPAPRQVLTFKGKELPTGNKKVKEVGIPDGGHVKVEVFAKVPITVTTMDDRKIKLMVDLSKDKLCDIKNQLEKATRVPVDNQRLFSGDGAELADDNDSSKKKKSMLSFGKKKMVVAEDYGIKESSVLYMEPKVIKFTIVMPNGKTHKVQVPPSSDMSDLIKALVKKTPDLAGVSGGQVFKFGDKELRKGKTIKDVGIREGSKVKLELNN